MLYAGSVELVLKGTACYMQVVYGACFEGDCMLYAGSVELVLKGTACYMQVVWSLF